MRSLAAAVLAFVFAVALAGSEHVVAQKNLAFAPKSLKVKAGDTIRFTNDDPVPHNVISLSKDNPFDLGVLQKGQAKSVALNNPGVVDVECSIHPGMKLKVEVEK
jgi:plastocyanin